MQYLIKIKQNSYYQETALEKTLFYTKLNNIFFGSEIKYIKSLSENSFEFNLSKVTKFCSHGYRSLKENNKTFYKNIYSLEPEKI